MSVPRREATIEILQVEEICRWGRWACSRCSGSSIFEEPLGGESIGAAGASPPSLPCEFALLESSFFHAFVPWVGFPWLERHIQRYSRPSLTRRTPYVKLAACCKPAVDHPLRPVRLEA